MTVLKKPLVTEKISELNEKGKYGFVVEKTANKIEIKSAIEKMYGVTVEKVATLRYQGKDKSRYSKSRVISGKAPSFKKAIVTLAEGDVIDFYASI